MKNKKTKLIVTLVLLTPIVVGAGISASLFSGKGSTNTQELRSAESYERSIATKSPGKRRIVGNGEEYVDYNYSFNNPLFNSSGNKAREQLFNLGCSNKNLETYSKGAEVTSTEEVLDKDGNSFNPKQYKTTSIYENPTKRVQNAYVCENPLLKFESFSEKFDNSHMLYRFVKIMEEGSMITLPLFDDLQSVRIHSEDRTDKSDRTIAKELFLPEAENIDLTPNEGPGSAADDAGFSLWGRWAEAIYSRDLSFQSSGSQVEDVKVDRFSSQRWLSLFFDYFVGAAGPSCLDVWGDFDNEEYFWSSLFAHEMYHHFLSPSIRDESNTGDAQVDYTFEKLVSNGGTYTSVETTNKIRSSLWDTTREYFSSVETAYWNNDGLAPVANTKVDLSAKILNKDISYSLANADLQYVYEPEELVVRLLSLLTYHWEGLDPDILNIRYDAGYDICQPSFMLKDYLSFNNSAIDINPFKKENFKNAIEVILKYLKFDQEVAYIKKGNGNERSISLQGWSKPGEHEKLVFEEINPAVGTQETKRNIVDLSWNVSNFFVREQLNSDKKKYVNCTDDFDKINLVNSWAESCQMWTTPSIDVEGLFDKFFTRTTEQNVIVSELENSVHVGFNVYFWSDLNNDGLIQDTEKTSLNIKDNQAINSRQMNIEPSKDCKISLMNTDSGTQLRRYVDASYKGQLQNIDQVCSESWSISS